LLGLLGTITRYELIPKLPDPDNELSVRKMSLSATGSIVEELKAVQSNPNVHVFQTFHSLRLHYFL